MIKKNARDAGRASKTNEAAPDSAPAAPVTTGSSYQVIARRYRPRFFGEVVGQEAAADSLRQAIRSGRLAHAYLFAGPRGVGKTSMARIFARALECPNAENGDPCDRCATCERILRGEDLDVAEMDGASHRGIEDVRDLIQHARYVPAAGPYRIFIIDEVHMLTREAFNALLKTLEEPPAHVKFIFCTTEPEKLPATVLSRCQRFDFAPISASDIVERLRQICAAEGATPEAGLLERIADLSRGGMRDSQSVLDQLLAFVEGTPTLADLDRLSGRMADSDVTRLVDQLEAADRAAVVTELDRTAREGVDPAVLLEQVVEEVRARLHRGVAGGWGDTEIERNLLAQEILQEARLRIRQLNRPEIVLELALLRVATVPDLVPIARWLDVASTARPAVQRAPVASSPPSAQHTRSRATSAMTSAPPPGPAAKPAPAPTSAPPPDAPAPALPDELDRVRQCVERSSRMLARSCTLRVAGESVEIDVTDSMAGHLNAGKRQALEEAIRQELKRPVRLVVNVRRDESEGSQESGGSPPAAARGAGPRALPEIVEKAREIFRGTLHGGDPRGTS